MYQLVAPVLADFYNGSWNYLGYRKSLQNRIARITGINNGVLFGDSCTTCGAAERMSWASQRRTTRVEDVAYWLLCLFESGRLKWHEKRLLDPSLSVLKYLLTKLSQDRSLSVHCPLIKFHTHHNLITSRFLNSASAP